MRISNSGLDLLKEREGVVLKMYRDSAGLPSIGVGHLLTRDELRSGKLWDGTKWSGGIAEEKAEELLRRDLAFAEQAVEDFVKVRLTENQHDTLVSFVFNVGGTAFRNSTLLKVLNRGEYDLVPGQLKRWKYSAGKVDEILVNRREDEIQQWRKG